MHTFFYPCDYFAEVVIRIVDQSEGEAISRRDVTVSPSYARAFAKELLKAARAAEKNEA